MKNYSKTTLIVNYYDEIVNIDWVLFHIEIVVVGENLILLNFIFHLACLFRVPFLTFFHSFGEFRQILNLTFLFQVSNLTFRIKNDLHRISKRSMWVAFYIKVFYFQMFLFSHKSTIINDINKFVIHTKQKLEE